MWTPPLLERGDDVPVAAPEPLFRAVVRAVRTSPSRSLHRAVAVSKLGVVSLEGLASFPCTGTQVAIDRTGYRQGPLRCGGSRIASRSRRWWFPRTLPCLRWSPASIPRGWMTFGSRWRPASPIRTGNWWNRPMASIPVPRRGSSTKAFPSRPGSPTTEPPNGLAHARMPVMGRHPETTCTGCVSPSMSSILRRRS